MVTSRIWFTAAQKAELWDRWRSGSSAAAISRALDRRNKTGVLRIVTLHGGIAPAPRRRALAAFRLEEREEISRGIAVGQSIRQIALGLGRAPSTVSREIRRNGGSQHYRANRADRSAWQRALRPKPCRLALHKELRWRVAQKLALQWSPEQISGWLKREFPTDEDRQISHEAIYRSLFVQTRGVLRKELTAHLRTRRQMRLPKSHNAGSGQGHILDMVSIRERPAEAQDRAVPGHWEGDLLTGGNDTHIATLIERHSRFTMLVAIREPAELARTNSGSAAENRMEKCRMPGSKPQTPTRNGSDDVENLSQIWAVAPALVKLALRDDRRSQFNKEPPWKRIAEARHWAM